jgi:hypothetical protein
MKQGSKLVGILLTAIIAIASYTGGFWAERITGDDRPASGIQPSAVETYFTRAGDKPEQALIRVIEGAQETLDIAIYSLTHPDIVAAIRDTAKRGVQVRLIEDKIQAGGKSQTEALKILGSAGVALKVNKHSGLMHLKVTIADGQIATGGSFNYSKAASTNSDEVLTVYRSEEIAREFSEQFEIMWNDDTRFETLERYIAMKEAVDTENKGTEATADTDAPSDPPAAACDNPTIKGNRNSGVYHVPGGQSYDQTTANVEYFCTEKEAEDAGYRKARR